MKQNDFHEVDGCTDFIPVKLIKEHKHLINTLELEVAESGLRTFAPTMYKFRKPPEPQKVVVPKYVAEWIEDHKGNYNEWNEEARADFVFRAINDLFRFGDRLSPWDFTIYEEFSKWTTENTYKFITAILFDYTVEQEKLYTVEIPDPNSHWAYTFLTNKGPGVYIDRTDGDLWKDASENQLTEAEIKKDFEWAWKWAKEVE